MQNSKVHKNNNVLPVAAVSAIAFFANLFLPSISLGQTDVSIDVTRTPYLSFNSIPESFSFGAVPTSISDTNIFSDSNGGLPSTSLLIVHDTRDLGGFTLQATTSGPFVASGAPSNTIPAQNLRMVTSTSLASILDAFQSNGVIYLSGYVGRPDNTTTQTIIAPLNATSNQFGTLVPFDEVETSPINNHLDTTLTLMNGCLTSDQGRVGYMGFATSEVLLIPKYQQPGSYSTTITYTLTDNTQTSC